MTIEWVKCSDRMPEKFNRYFIKTSCEGRTQKALRHNWPYPCGKVNIAYYCWDKNWEYHTDLPVTNKVTHWAEIEGPIDD